MCKCVDEVDLDDVTKFQYCDECEAAARQSLEWQEAGLCATCGSNAEQTAGGICVNCMDAYCYAMSGFQGNF